MEEIKDKTSNDIKLIIIGNKIDLKDYREVTNEEAIEKAKALGVPIMETSALDATNVNKAFHDLLKEIYKDMKNKIKNIGNSSTGNKDGIQLETNEKKKSGCC